MFYSYNNRTDLVINCAVVPDSDVSGIGVRGAFYTQAIILILLSINIRTEDVFLSNLSIQITSAALLCAAWFSPTIDVPHTLVASQFAVMLSACRITPYDLPPRVLRTREGMILTARMTLLDILFRTGLVLFNLRLWMMVR